MKCVVCDSQFTKATKIYRVKEMMLGSREVFEYLECECCGTLQIANIPLNISNYYPNDYYSLNNNFIGGGVKDKLIKIRNRFILGGNNIIGYVISLLKDDVELKNIAKYLSKGDAILDVGCGDGKFLRKLNVGCFKALIGIDKFIKDDIDDDVYKIRKSTIFEVNDFFDVIFFNHSFEHLECPYQVLKKAASLLCENGKIILRIPTTSSYAWKEYRENWVQIDAPRHYYLYSRVAIDIIAMKCGLKIVDTVYDSNEFQFIGSEQYRKNIALFSEQSYYPFEDKSKLVNGELHKFRKQAKKLNKNKLGDQAIFVLEKNDG